MGERNSRRTVSAAKVQNLKWLRDPKSLNQCLSGVTHKGSNLSEVALFPQRFVWIHNSTLFQHSRRGIVM